MPQFYTLLTDTGQAKLANAVALGGTIEITELAVGDGGGSLPSPDSSATALINEVRRAAINTSIVDPDNPSWIVVEQVLPPDVGGWTIREIGIIDADGDLIGIGNYPETYKPVLAEGSSRTQTVRFVLEVSDTAAVTLKVDPSVVLATREYVDQERTEHEAGRAHPAATESLQGMIKRASQAKALASSDNADAMTALRTFQLLNKYGIGKALLPDDGWFNLDTWFDGGFKFVRNETTAPTLNSFLVIGICGATSAVNDRAAQVAFDYETNRVYCRTYQATDGAWFAWSKIYTAENLVQATTGVAGIVEKATTDESKSGAADKFPDAAGVLAAMKQFGLGTDALSIIGDLNIVFKTRFLGYSNSSTGAPTTGQGSVLTVGRSSLASTQFAMEYGAGDVYVRHYAEGAWKPWARLHNDDNLKKATQAQVDAGTDDSRYVTSSKLKNWVRQATESVMGFLKIATQAQVDAGTDDTTAVTPLKLRFGVDYSLGLTGYIAFPSWLGGLIMQWGENAVAGTVNFPIVFPTAEFIILTTDYGDNNQDFLSAERQSSSAFVINSSLTGTNSRTFWLALGN